MQCIYAAVFSARYTYLAYVLFSFKLANAFYKIETIYLYAAQKRGQFCMMQVKVVVATH